jgi:hypothetical protein
MKDLMEMHRGMNLKDYIDWQVSKASEVTDGH